VGPAGQRKGARCGRSFLRSPFAYLQTIILFYAQGVKAGADKIWGVGKLLAEVLLPGLQGSQKGKPRIFQLWQMKKQGFRGFLAASSIFLERLSRVCS
jgi:hypothetical protein